MSQLVAPGDRPLRADARRNREKVLSAAREVFSEHGRDAQMDDVARRAGVGVGTVYRHFPSLDELVPACGAVSLELAALPDPAGAPALFEGLATPAERIARLVEEAHGIYGRAAKEMQVTRREPDAHPTVAEANEAFETTLSALVDAAVAPFELPPAERALVRAMIDLDTWEALRAAGLDPAAASAAVSEMLTARIA